MAPDPWPLVGRAAPCETIRSLLADDPPRNVVVAGPAGVGRTRMAREALSWAERQGRPVLWASATGPAAQVPLGALAHLIPALDVASDPLVLLQRATRAVVGDRTGPRPVLGVDDVHLLDQLSMTLLHQLAAGGQVSLVLTVRTGDVPADPAAPLWKDGLATRVDLQPLSRAETERLVAAVLDGDVETRTLERLWQLTRGNPLYLREVVENGVESGRLAPEEGIWRWAGRMTPSPRLGEIVLAQLGALDPDEWRALEALATAEPLSVHQLVELSSSHAVATLERRGLVTDGGAQGSGSLCAAHPVYTAVVRSRVSATALRLVRHRLAGGAGDWESGDQLVRRCLAVLDSDLPPPGAAELAEAAGQALLVLDLSAAERLARAASTAAGDPEGALAGHLVLAETLRWLGEPVRSRSVVSEAAALARSDVDSARVAVAAAFGLVCGPGRADEATATLQEAATRSGSAEARALLDAAGGMISFLRGDPREGLAVEPAAHAVPFDGPARPMALAAAAANLAVSGQTTRALAAARAGWSALESGPQAAETVLARLVLEHAEVVALHLAGRIEDLEHRTTAFHRRNLGVPEWTGDAVASLHCGWAALARGRPRRAVRWLMEAHIGLQRHDPLGARQLCRTLLALTRGLLGDSPGVHELVEDGGNDREGLAAFAAYGGLADALQATVEGSVAGAAGIALTAAGEVAARGHAAAQALLLHQAVRFGAAAQVVGPLADLAGRLDAPLVDGLAAHAQALVADDGARLLEVSHRLQETGALLLAGDAAGEAAAAYERAGDRRRAAECRARAMVLARKCGLSETPLSALVPPALTSREYEVATLASRGLSNQEIADRLVVSVRTVETHLSHVYTKFGIASRGDLVTSLATALPAHRAPGGQRVGLRT